MSLLGPHPFSFAYLETEMFAIHHAVILLSAEVNKRATVFVMILDYTQVEIVEKKK